MAANWVSNFAFIFLFLLIEIPSGDKGGATPAVCHSDLFFFGLLSFAFVPVQISPIYTHQPQSVISKDCDLLLFLKRKPENMNFCRDRSLKCTGHRFRERAPQP